LKTIKEVLYRVDEEALQIVEERLFDEELFNYAVEISKEGIFLKSYDKKIDEILNEMGFEPLEIREVDPLEWAKNQLKEPFILTSGVIVDHVGNYKGNEMVLRISPGMAFGTGIHPTTKLCAKAIVRYLKPRVKFLDVGTGSGILSILAAKLGASKVVATDLDEQSIKIAKENAEKNDVKVEFIKTDLVEGINEQFDFIVSNIVPAVLRKLAESILKVSKKGTILVLSGIDLGRLDEISKLYENRGFKEIERETMEEWGALILRLSESS
jgi:ribosomal protein L11 methyltransferase